MFCVSGAILRILTSVRIPEIRDAEFHNPNR
nr:MAG TPA_asm: hypothetical protein [Caudoviricetes sp.]